MPHAVALRLAWPAFDTELNLANALQDDIYAPEISKLLIFQAIFN
jgi:hypothetical protein